MDRMIHVDLVLEIGVFVVFESLGIKFQEDFDFPEAKPWELGPFIQVAHARNDVAIKMVY